MRKHAVRAIALAAAVAAAAAAVHPPSAGAEELPPPALVLGDGRYGVTATFQAPGAPVSPAFPVELTRDTGYFWFFDRDNVELVVKVLEACPVNEHVWVFAAGLTNVAVELTVEDRLAEETWNRSHPAGPPFPPIQDTAAFASCDLGALCGQGTAAEIAATPRADEEAELIALFLGGGLTAPEPLYQRVSAELAALRALDPTLADVPFLPRHDARTLLVRVDDPQPLLAGTFTAWDCSNDWYAVTRAELAGGELAVVEFAGRLDTERIAAEYALLPGIQSAEPNLGGRLSEFSPFLCAIAEGERIHYFTQQGGTPDRRHTHWVTDPGGAPQPAGTWFPATGDPEPPWFPLFEQCVELSGASCCVLS